MKAQDILERNRAVVERSKRMSDVGLYLIAVLVAAATTMDEPVVKKQDKLITMLKDPGERDEGGGVDDGDPADDEQCDAEVWDKLSWSFLQAQSVLDQNRALIQQVNENHQSKIRDNLVKNVALIDQLNGNISKVLSIYSDLSIDFSNIVRRRRRRRRRATTVSTEDGKDSNIYNKEVESTPRGKCSNSLLLLTFEL